jgi:hypothetical protein
MNHLHDLEEDYSPYHSSHGIPGSTLDTNLNDREEYENSAKNIGMKVCEVVRG